MRIPRPDLDALIWLAGCEDLQEGDPVEPVQRLHAINGTEIFCGYSGPLDVRRLLWIDRAEISTGENTAECSDCQQLEHRKSGSGEDEMVAIYGARQGRKDNDLKRHILALGPSFSEWDYRLDIARTRFDDGIGCYFAIWRRSEPGPNNQRRRLP